MSLHTISVTVELSFGREKVYALLSYFPNFSRRYEGERMPYSRLTLVVTAAFLVGIPTSSQTTLSKFSRYERPAHIQQIDWLVIQINLQLLRDWVANPLQFIDTPVVTFNHKTRRMEALVLVDADELNKLTTVEVKARLGVAALYAGENIHSMMDGFDASNGRDFYMEFRGLSIQGARENLPISTFAEFQDGHVVLH
jgi:hypothetical protein